MYPAEVELDSSQESRNDLQVWPAERSQPTTLPRRQTTKARSMRLSTRESCGVKLHVCRVDALSFAIWLREIQAFG